MMEALQSNTTLINFDLELQLSPPCLDLVSTMLCHNTHLQDLRIHLHASVLQHPQRIQNFFITLERKNNSLKSFTNYGLLGLRTSSSSNNNNNHDNAALNHAEFQMLEKNVSLEKFTFFNQDTSTRQRREMYLRLNRLGRRRVLHTNHNNNINNTIQHHEEKEVVVTTRSDWVDQLIQHSNDIDGLLYYLLANPSLCRIDNDTTATTSKNNNDNNNLSSSLEDTHSSDYAIHHKNPKKCRGRYNHDNNDDENENNDKSVEDHPNETKRKRHGSISHSQVLS
jgi:hypothetical protein